MNFTFVIPVYNRPEEIRELFQSLVNQTYQKSYEIVLVEDGSKHSSADVAEEFKDRLPIVYYSKPNTGPGDSRNYGMSKATGNYFLLVDSDCILPANYLQNVENSLIENYADCFGGPDTADESFSVLQKAINYVMTSFLTTGGIRGHKNAAKNFQPRSFNMGLSKKAFEVSGGFAEIHPGEDPDLSIRLKKLGFSTRYMDDARVFHKRRINFSAFYKQVRKFGLVRPILNKWHPGSARISYWFPVFYSIGLLLALVALFFGFKWPAFIFGLYFVMILLDSLLRTRSIAVPFLALLAMNIQFFGYGFGFLKSFILVNFSKKKPRELFPDLFFEPTLT